MSSAVYALSFLAIFFFRENLVCRVASADGMRDLGRDTRPIGAEALAQLADRDRSHCLGSAADRVHEREQFVQHRIA